jgi:hypothetical protein
LVARKLLTSHNSPVEEAKIANIVDSLTEKMFSHGHAIGRKEAKAIGLPLEEMDEKQNTLAWDLYIEYERFLKLDEPLDVEDALETAKVEEQTLPHFPIAVIESNERCDVLETNVVMKRKRNIPPNPQINLNLSFPLPPHIDPANVPQEIQVFLQMLNNQLTQSLPFIVQNELVRQSPLVGFDLRTYGSKWVLLEPKTVVQNTKAAGKQGSTSHSKQDKKL